MHEPFLRPLSSIRTMHPCLPLVRYVCSQSQYVCFCFLHWSRGIPFQIADHIWGHIYAFDGLFIFTAIVCRCPHANLECCLCGRNYAINAEPYICPVYMYISLHAGAHETANTRTTYCTKACMLSSVLPSCMHVYSSRTHTGESLHMHNVSLHARHVHVLWSDSNVRAAASPSTLWMMCIV